MNAAVRAPVLTTEAVWRLVRTAGREGTTLALLAEDLDVPVTSMTLKLAVAVLVQEGRVRWAVRAGRDVLVAAR